MQNSRFRFSLLIAFLVAKASTAQVPVLALSEEESGQFFNPVLFAGNIGYFSALHDRYTPSQITVWDGDSASPVVSLSTANPAAPDVNLTAFFNLASDGEALYFTANSSAAFGGSYSLFRYDGNEVTTLVGDSRELAPEDSLVGLSGLSVGGGKAVFSLRQGDYHAYFLHDGEALVRIADTDTGIAEGSGAILEFPTTGAVISANGEHIVIWVKTADAPGVGQPDQYTVFRFVDDALEAVATNGDDLGDGYTISRMPTRPIVLNDGTILVDVQTVPSGGATARIAPDNSLSILPLPALDDELTASLGGIPTTANDGFHVYTRLMAYGPGFVIASNAAVRYDAEGNFTTLFELPHTAGGQDWGESQFQFMAANGGDYLVQMQNTESVTAVFTNIEELAAGETWDEPGESFWSDYPDYGGWKLSSALGWIYDALFPLIYCDAFESWGWIAEAGGSINGFHLYIYAEDSWFWSAEDLGGWVYQLSGGNDDPGWRNLGG